MKVNGDLLDVMFWDLTPEAQKILLDFLGVSSPDECNYSVVPVAMIHKSELKLIRWTKKLDLIHYALPGFHSGTLCGKPMLGNNYASMYPKGLRQECPTCLKEIEARGLKI